MQNRQNKPSSKAASSVLGRTTFAAITAVEGLRLTASGEMRLATPISPEQRRADVIKAYSGHKGRK